MKRAGRVVRVEVVVQIVKGNGHVRDVGHAALFDVQVALLADLRDVHDIAVSVERNSGAVRVEYDLKGELGAGLAFKGRLELGRDISVIPWHQVPLCKKVSVLVRLEASWPYTHISSVPSISGMTLTLAAASLSIA